MEKGTHYLVLSLKRVKELLKTAKEKSIKNYGKVATQSTIIVDLKEEKGYVSRDGLKQINIVEVG